MADGKYLHSIQRPHTGLTRNLLLATLLLFVTYGCICGNTIENVFGSRRCSYDTECVENAYCKNQTYCNCKANYVIYMGPKGPSCLKEGTQLGDSCEQDLQCTKPFGTHALCGSDDRCQCLSTAHFKEGRCYETSKLGVRCKVTNNCKIDSNIAVFCDKGVCICPYKYHPNSDGTDCLKSSYIGQPCTNDESCVMPNSRCSAVCRCRTNYIKSEDGRRCLKESDHVGEKCEESAQCSAILKTAECNNGTCQCSKYHHSVPTSKICWRSVSLGAACSNDNECLVTSGNASLAVCRQGNCHCASGYTVHPSDPQDCTSNGFSRDHIQHHIMLVAIILYVLSISILNSSNFQM